MEDYTSKRGSGLGFMLLMTALYNIVILILFEFTNSYIIDNLLKLLLVFCNIYQIYYMVLFQTLKCTFDSGNLKIHAI